MRGALFATAGMNIGGAALFTPPARALRARGSGPGRVPAEVAHPGQRLGRVELERRALGAGELARRTPRGQGMGAAAELERHRGDVALRHVDVPARRVAVDVAGERARIT